MTRFGDFEPLCKNTPSYPWCNLFYRQVSLFIVPAVRVLADRRAVLPVAAPQP